MYYFNSDYTEGAHPRILQKLIDTNMDQTGGYGEDAYCREARELIRRAVNCPDADVHFLVGGTQTNYTVISSILRPYEGVLCAPTGHINVHETGAVEARGHKVLTVTGAESPEEEKALKDGKITASQIRRAVLLQREDGAHEHIVKPGMVYISLPTELGTLYSLEELTAISRVCRGEGLPLFVDGARLGYALGAPANDISLPDLASLADVFYIGGTKVGLLFGEAVVITAEPLKKEFRYMMKQSGAMLAKGRLLGVQFGEAFRDDLYTEMGRHAMGLALRLKQAFLDKGYPLYADSPTNQQFFILPDEKLEKLSQNFVFEPSGRVDETHRAARFCTSWATTEEAVDALIRAL
ncbi:MAG: low specificity L-threonine aldolase [Lachnospiraceae bacterium]|nr:low specificity L-threonine aldolase [Lachnospiraceae bacterium]